MDIGSIGTERNKVMVAEFDELIGSDDLSPLDRLCRPDMVNHALALDRPSGWQAPRDDLACFDNSARSPVADWRR
jgi:hypothetical protein